MLLNWLCFLNSTLLFINSPAFLWVRHTTRNSVFPHWFNLSLSWVQYKKRTGDIRQGRLKSHQIEKSNPQNLSCKDNVGIFHQGNAPGFSVHASSPCCISRLCFHSFISCLYLFPSVFFWTSFFHWFVLLFVFFVWLFQLAG